MKSITLTCKCCGKTITIKGGDLDTIINKIDESGWIDSSNGDMCPECYTSLSWEDTI